LREALKAGGIAFDVLKYDVVIFGQKDNAIYLKVV
jgi:hypothetical protein